MLLTDEANQVNEISMDPPLGEATQGHKTVYFDLNFESSRPAIFESRKLNYRLGNYEKLSAIITETDWDEIFKNLSIDEAYKVFTNVYESACRKCIPPKKPRTFSRPPWFNKEIKSLVKKKRELWHSNKRTGWRCTSLIAEYKQTRNSLRKETRRAIKSHELEIASDKKNPKRLFAYIQSKQARHIGISAITDDNGVTHTNGESMASTLNAQFCSAFTQDQQVTALPSIQHRAFSKVLDNIQFSRDEIGVRLNKLDRYKSPGVDGISSYVLKECSTAFASPLAILFNRSFVEGILPSAWLEANVKPLFKKGSRLDPSNYRPISLTSIVCKVMETIIRDSLLFHLVESQLISKQQHGFVPKKSCTTNLLETIDFVTLNMSKKRPVDIVFLDFSKAFDKVSHRSLLYKLEAYGIQGRALTWIKAFLSKRRQRVILGNSFSEWSDVLSGVPQGSVLGPLLFVIFVKDLTNVIKNTCKLYADDCKLLAPVRDAHDAASLQSDIHAVQKWCKDWMMELNIGKCRVMHCGNRNPKNAYIFADSTNSTSFPLEVTYRERDLGIIITPDMKWGDQVANAVGKASRALGVLKKTFKSRDPKLWKKLYATHIRSHLEFGVAAWNPYQRGDIALLERAQRRVTRVPYKFRGLTYEDRCKRLGLTSLEKRRIRGDLIQQFKISKGIESLSFELPSNDFLREIAPRGGKRSRLRREIVKSCNQRHNFFTNRIVNIWNELPDNIITATSTNGFKNRLDTATAHKRQGATS